MHCESDINLDLIFKLIHQDPLYFSEKLEITHSRLDTIESLRESCLIKLGFTPQQIDYYQGNLRNKISSVNNSPLVKEVNDSNDSLLRRGDEYGDSTIIFSLKD